MEMVTVIGLAYLVFLRGILDFEGRQLCQYSFAFLLKKDLLENCKMKEFGSLGANSFRLK